MSETLLVMFIGVFIGIVTTIAYYELKANIERQLKRGEGRSFSNYDTVDDIKEQEASDNSGYAKGLEGSK